MMTEDGKTEEEEVRGSGFIATLALLAAMFFFGACVGMQF